ncbi:MAG TPA: DUF429 domain-containing protein [Candidatus Eisenbacteria bacterium]
MAASFIGIDLAWSPRNSTGLAVLKPSRSALRVHALRLGETDDEIREFVSEHLARLTVVMIDAPLVIPNRGGMRECDRLTHVEFGRQQAGCYPANRENMGRYTGGIPRGERIGKRLHRLGFPWPLGSLPGAGVRAGHWLFECYPHPAQVRLFRLDRVLKYKKKRQPWDQARAEFRRYLGLVRALRRPRLRLPVQLEKELDVTQAVGRGYKRREDLLDAVFCAYLAALVPYGALEMLGEPRRGSIVVPRREAERLGPRRGTSRR